MIRGSGPNRWVCVTAVPRAIYWSAPADPAQAHNGRKCVGPAIPAAQEASINSYFAAIPTVVAWGASELFLEQPIEVAEAEDADIGRNHRDRSVGVD